MVNSTGRIKASLHITDMTVLTKHIYSLRRSIMQVRELMELLSHAKQDAEVSLEYLVSSEYGEYIDGDCELDADHVSVESDHVIFHLFA
jgi:prefoldin subunit 5